MSTILKTPFPTADAIRAEFPRNDRAAATVENARAELKNVFAGDDSRKILIIGPCSADFEDSLLEYAGFVSELRRDFGDAFEIVMRFYTGKPRTLGGWKGLQQGTPGTGPDFSSGIRECRRIMVRVLETGVPIADEMLHPHLFPYFEDLLSYAAVGARSSENQFHREAASALDMPVGMKNPMDGDLKTALNSVLAARSPSAFVLEGEVWKTDGNPYAHLVLRGSKRGPNCDYATLAEYRALASDWNRPGLIVDASHGNSDKKASNQPKVLGDLLGPAFDSIRNSGFDPDAIVKGFMVESYLETGRQDYSPGCRHGLSLTDECLGLDETRAMVASMAERLRSGS